MENLTVWLNANKISLNVEKTDLVIFKHQEKNSALKLILNLIDCNFTILHLLDILVLKLNKSELERLH